MKLLAPLSVKSGIVWLRKVIALKSKKFGGFECDIDTGKSALVNAFA